MKMELFQNKLITTVILLLGITLVSSANNPWVEEVNEKLESFTFNLYKNINKGLNGGDNMVFSPLSIFSALSLLGQGARNETRKQITDAIGYDIFVLIQAYVHQTFNQENNDDYDLKMAQRIFVNNSTLLQKDFKSFLLQAELPSVRRLDFEVSPQQSRELINKWVERHTMNQIKNLLSEDQVTSLTRLFIVNALALEAPWNSPFDMTVQDRFMISEDEQIKTKMLKSMEMPCVFAGQIHSFFPSTDRGDLRNTVMLVLPFKGKKLTFIAVMPNKAGDFSEINTSLGQRKLFYMINKLLSNSEPHYYDCDVTMPKLDLNYNYANLKGDLEEMGIKDVFDSELADLTGIYRGEEELYVSDVAHKATFTLDKDGVKASAATAFGSSTRTMPPRITIDKPFLFFVRNQDTGALLFMGKVANPASS